MLFLMPELLTPTGGTLQYNEPIMIVIWSEIGKGGRDDRRVRVRSYGATVTGTY